MRERFGTYTLTLGACAVASLLGLTLVLILKQINGFKVLVGTVTEAKSIHST